MTTNYLKYIVEEIHTTIVATVDSENHPVTCAIDMMHSDENGLYFLTAKGKNFYQRLKKQEYLSLTGLKGENTMSCIAVSLQGKVKEVGPDLLPTLFEKNPYMNEIYPTSEARQALTVFQIYEGHGEWFDLSKKPIERASFSIGEMEKKEMKYIVNSTCIGCHICVNSCPQHCIDITTTPVIIEQNHCLHCGNCLHVCPVHAIERSLS